MPLQPSYREIADAEREADRKQDEDALRERVASSLRAVAADVEKCADSIEQGDHEGSPVEHMDYVWDQIGQLWGRIERMAGRTFAEQIERARR